MADCHVINCHGGSPCSVCRARCGPVGERPNARERPDCTSAARLFFWARRDVFMIHGASPTPHPEPPAGRVEGYLRRSEPSFVLLRNVALARAPNPAPCVRQRETTKAVSRQEILRHGLTAGSGLGSGGPRGFSYRVNADLFEVGVLGEHVFGTPIADAKHLRPGFRKERRKASSAARISAAFRHPRA